MLLAKNLNLTLPALLRSGVILVFFMACAFNLSAQKPPVRWGKVTSEEQAIKEVSYDPEASAVILCDFGKARFSGTNLFIDIHRRIKILKSDGLSKHSDISIPYYVKDNVQNITNIKAQTLNPSGSKTKAHTLGKSEIFESDYSENWKIKTFTFPQVKVGSIIEYSYTLASDDLLYLENWDFENDIPTLHSEFWAIIPDYLDYRIMLQGSRIIRQYGGQTRSKWMLKNLKAVEKEPYMIAVNNYRERIRFQLSGYYATSSGKDQTPKYRSLMTTWEKLNHQMMSSTSFGGQLKNRALSKQILSVLNLEGVSEHEKAIRIYEHVQKSYDWDGSYQLFPEEDIKQLTQSREGNSADINLMLCMLLKNAELEATPMLISTRGHGLVSENYPLLSQFNHVIVLLSIGGKEIVLDATDPHRPFDLLAMNDLNGKGLVLSENDNPRWTEIAPTESNSRTLMFSINLQDLEKPKAQIQGAFKGYYARNLREALSENKTNIIPVTTSNVATADWQVKNQDQLQKPLSLSSPDLDMSLEQAGDRIYLQPILVNYYPANPFNAESRSYPIDFGAPFTESYHAEVILPPGYILEELPDPELIKLPKNRGTLQYQVTNSGGKVQLIMKMDITGWKFGVGQYSKLKQFFDLAIEKFNTPLVLSRN